MLFDWVELGRVGRQVEHFGSCGLDPFANAGYFV